LFFLELDVKRFSELADAWAGSRKEQKRAAQKFQQFS
jgi:hypothetical protein